MRERGNEIGNKAYMYRQTERERERKGEKDKLI